ncbi:hypothetical protein Ctob_009531 [Chrysochromulina tobinii]|uniref:Uncharacterized protein n=1 Tax=Chrysochromulina tobinii TaxID=1460289 RepID=A0A0M0JMB3_9EUKA|nr:hypothetical protein Ctob_009531 [Chrysochromulina tobinii]|eukprot:KOO27716.1 hypothetical protein Ctob_009531 [Chrysochromulina sp. CCMP291]
MGASKTIVAYDDDGFVDTDGDGIPDEVTEVENVLWQNYRIISNVYNYFASVEGPPHFLSVVGFNAFLDHFALVQKRSRFCTRSDFEMLVEAVQASSAQVHSSQDEVDRWASAHIPAVAAFCEQRAKDRLAAAVAAAEKALEESLKAEAGA